MCVSLAHIGVDAGGGAAQGGALVVCHGNASGNVPGVGQDEDLYTLEAEITELQRQKVGTEFKLERMRSEINAMENHLKHGDKVSLRYNYRRLISNL